MCGIVGLFLKTEKFAPDLGAHMAAMLGVMCERGPDSAGFAVYGSGEDGKIKFTLRLPEMARDKLAAAFTRRFSLPAELSHKNSHVILAVPAGLEPDVRQWLAAEHPEVHLVGVGTRMELYKDVGLPNEVAKRFGLSQMTGTHAIGHTRMATESSVTTDGSHPFSTGIDQCLVHNGSLSNHNAVRRMLRREGLS